MSPSIDSTTLHAIDQRSASLPSRPAVSRAITEHRVESNAETDFEVAFLLRHFTEGPGLWYDFLKPWTVAPVNFP